MMQRSHPVPIGSVSAVMALGCLAVSVMIVPACRRPVERPPAGPAGGPPSQPTFTRDVAPILFRECAICHRAGEVAPFSLLSYDDARRKAETIVKVTASRAMPPWLPHPDSGPFEGERRLTDEEIEILRRWHLSGTPEGDPAALPPTPQFPDGWALGDPDLVVELPQAFDVPAEGRDLYRNFVIPVPLERVRRVAAMEFQPDRPTIVHHAFLLLDTTRASRRLDDKDAEPGFPGMVPGPTATSPPGHFASWQPGAVPRRYPAGTSWKLAPNTDLIIQVHLRTSGKPESIRPRVGFWFTDDPPERTPFKMVLTTTEIDIPAGEPAWNFEQRYTLPVAVHVLGVLPHAHYLGRELHGFALLPDGTKRWLMRIDRWDFDWQGAYRYADPVMLPAGSVLVQRFTYDNSANNPDNPHQPPERVRHGTETTDEMGELWFQLLPATARDAQTLSRDYFLHAARRRSEELTLKRARGQASAHDLAELGRALIPLGRDDDAMARLRESIAADSAADEPHYLLGTLFAKRNDAVAASEAFARAVELRPDHAGALNGLGVYALREHNASFAADFFRRAAAADPQNSMPLKNLALACSELGRFDEARRVIGRALELTPEDAQAQAISRRLSTGR